MKHTYTKTNTAASTLEASFTSPNVQTLRDLKTALLTVSLTVNAVLFVLWLTVQVISL